MICCHNAEQRIAETIKFLALSQGHKDRFAFINKLKGHYKDSLDWFSKGGDTFLSDKWEGLTPYYYSIAIENSSFANYFTEKISDCFLAYTMPFYAGCQNIKDFFDERSFVQIDTKDFVKSINIIDDVINAGTWRENLSYIEESRSLVLEKYHFLAALTDILKSVEKNKVKVNKTIRPQSYFDDGIVIRLLKSSARKLIRK